MNGSGNRGASPGGMALLRAAVAGYLIYLGVTLVRDHLNGRSAMAPWLAWACGVVFVLAGAAFGWFTWRKYRADTAEKPEEAGEPDKAEAPEEVKEAASPEAPEAWNEPAGPEDPAGPGAPSEEKGTAT